MSKTKKMLSALDEALKCNGVTAGVGELPNINFTHSRRLQLAVEESQLLPSSSIDDLPGIGSPQWRIHLRRIRTRNRAHVIYFGWTDVSYRYISLLLQYCNNKNSRVECMARRYVSIWFQYLTTDWFSRHQPELKTLPFVLRTSEHGRMVITAANATAEQ